MEEEGGREVHAEPVEYSKKRKALVLVRWRWEVKIGWSGTISELEIDMGRCDP